MEGTRFLGGPNPFLAALVCLLALAGCGGSDSGGRSAHAPKSVPGRNAPRGDFLRLQKVAGGLDRPLGLVAAPGSGTLYVVEQGGRVVDLRTGATFADLSDTVRAGGEQGLLGMAFHPGYARNGRVFLHYTNKAGDTRVDEYRVARSAGAIDRSTRRELLAVHQPFPNHNGGQLAFGPDGLLYLGLGDGGSERDPDNRAQDLGDRLGKILRLDVDHPGTGWQVAAYGMRNPWRFSFDRSTGSLWVGDVGQDEVEEIDAVPKLPTDPPLNFGWPAFEGTNDLDSRDPKGPGRLVWPVAEYTHDEGCSVTGGFVYRGREVPKLRGRYVYGDLCTGRIWTLRAGASSASDVRREDETVEQLASFGEGA
ncbi:MAG: hypothetical protein QOG63_735, partial [Thermoleophilaceae bacterium]|nr:hypothetical protein [Thermoleophilaceae bacterium]